MQFDFRKTLGSPAELAKLDSSLDDYLALEGTTLSRLKFKRRGPARSGMLETLAQMAMLFAAANMGDRNEYEACLMDILNQTVLDDGHKRSLREFYLRNLSRIPGTLGTAVGRLAAAREAIIGMPLEESSEEQ